MITQPADLQQAVVFLEDEILNLHTKAGFKCHWYFTHFFVIPKIYNATQHLW